MNPKENSTYIRSERGMNVQPGDVEFNIPKTIFDLSYEKLMTFKPSYLVPIYRQETLPGDVFDINTTVFARIQTMMSTVYDGMRADVYFFYERYRNVWVNFEKMMGYYENPGDSISYTFPKLYAATGFEQDGFTDLLGGNPTKVAPTTCHVLYHRAYKDIWNWYFRDHELQDSIEWSKGDEQETYSETTHGLLRVNKIPDLFTVARPTVQAFQDVTVPIGDQTAAVNHAQSILVKWSGIYNTDDNNGHSVTVATSNDPYYHILHTSPNSKLKVYPSNSTDGSANLYVNLNDANLSVDLSDIDAFNVRELRYAYALQTILEKDMMYGHTYEAIVNNFWDAKLDLNTLVRPVYIGGTSSYSVYKTVEQTTADETTPQGTLVQNGIINLNTNVHFRAPEHGMILGFICVRADESYQQGQSPDMQLNSRYDMGFSDLQDVGMQEVKKGNLFYTGDPAQDEAVHGYVPREFWRQKRTREISGQFKSNHTLTQHHKHLAENITSCPNLNGDFVQSHLDTIINRTVAVENVDPIECSVEHRVTAIRPLRPTYHTLTTRRL